jgi:hypothetical protein
MMKKFSLLASLVLCLATPRARAITSPDLVMGYFQVTVSNALYAVTNNNDSPDKKAVSTLKRALATIEKTATTNVAADTKTLSTLATSISHSSVSNLLGDDLVDTVAFFYNWELGHANSSSNDLNSAFSSGTKTAAGRNLSQAFKFLSGDASNLPKLAKAVSNASKKLVVADKLVEKALNIPPPPAKVSVSITGALKTSFSSKGADIQPLSPGIFRIIGSIGTKTVDFQIFGVTDGTHDVAVTDGTVSAFVGHGVVLFNDATGTANVTYNSTTHTMFGTFTFTATGTGGTSGSVTVTGSFNGTSD